ncbi:xanthine dehydrogenase YagR molybdenum-binding subunit [Granulicella pectinivorans]|uniref:Xanthine dehydrogenase YagR molybdenum-binding subunit n=1 Tax=Granulicella pectinivorans TaxID=474950 RepID=A0A1I6LBJ9_9BACT|nr:xanthine dehydrogenase family protein molybdopterin-binding subunit [Granulicella pectinivorans]SFS00826.1 xanthine dehydrogenase YagR molybdenum-binding subunit [Granulicella pectinivorans]
MFTDNLEFIQTGVTEAPAGDPAPLSSIIGSAIDRVDGPLKTTGTARYAADYNLPHMAYAVPVCATIANGSIASLDTSVAEKMPGVLLILHHGNIDPIFRMSAGRGGRTSESRPPFEDETVSYWGQYVALAVAETFQQAQAAAAAVKVTYKSQAPNVTKPMNDPEPPAGAKIESHRGDSEAAFAAAPIKLDATYTTPAETHNPMEMHATTAVWNGDKVTLYESSQGVVNALTVMAQHLGIPKENITIIARFIGSGFGGKLFPWPHSALCAVAARRTDRPVKLMVSRKMMFSNVGHRPRTQQRMRLATDAHGKLVSLQQDYRNHTSFGDTIKENCGEATPFLYSVPNLKVTSSQVRRNIGTPTPMRGPGAVPGLFALESAMDELAIQLKQDPVAFRLAHDTLIDEEKNKPFTSRHLKECLQIGAEKFGWSKRTPEVGSMKKGDLILGWGVACASWGAGRGGSEATVSLKSDGTARVASATQDIGTGTYTIAAQILSDKTGIPVDKIEVVLGDSSLPPGPMSGGSTATASLIPSIADAANNAIKSMLANAGNAKGTPFFGKQPDALAMSKGRVHLKDESPEAGMAFADVLKAARVGSATGDGKTGPAASENKDAANHSSHSFGAQFVEVEWDPGIAHLRVSRVVSVVDAGRILNPKTAGNQMAGAIIMGIGMGMMEETIYDPRNGHAINDNFADYIVPTAADSPDISVHFTNIPDPFIGEYGARGIGEIGLAGIAPAMTAAVYHATGVRVRNLPIRIEDLLQQA